MRPSRLAALLAAVALTACQGSPEPSAVGGEIPVRTGDASPVASATDRPSPEAEGTPSATDRPSPEADGTPSVTATPTATATPEPTSSPGDTPNGTPTGPVELEATVIASDLEAPWSVAFTPDGRALVAERDTGRILEVQRGGAATAVQEIEVNNAGEGGLLGIAAAPDAAGGEPLLYAYHTTDEDNRIVRFRLGEEPEPVLTGIPSARIHNGGRIAFGPDGMLYAGTGDAGEDGLARDPESPAGKILRLEPDGSVPDDNPTPGSLVYSLGHRNVQGLAWTAAGQLYATEFGANRDDEINRIEPGGNYGWPEVTGEAGQGGFIDPVFVQQPDDASWSGATFLVDGAIPQWEGNLFAGGLRGERLWRLEIGEDGQVADAEALFVGELGRLRLAAQAPDGSLWVLTNNRDGRGNPTEADDRILRIAPAGG